MFVWAFVDTGVLTGLVFPTKLPGSGNPVKVLRELRDWYGEGGMTGASDSCIFAWAVLIGDGVVWLLG